MERLSLSVSGMSCAGCETRIASVLARLDGVGNVEPDHGLGTVVVDYDPAAVDDAAITRRLREAGYETVAGPRR